MFTGRWAYKYLGEGGGRLNYKRQYKVFWQRRYMSTIWGNSCQTSQNCMIIFQILSLEISTSQISTSLKETQKNSEQINQTLTRTTTQVSYWFIIYSLLYSEIILHILFQPAKTVDILRRHHWFHSEMTWSGKRMQKFHTDDEKTNHIWLALLIGQAMEEGNLLQ